MKISEIVLENQVNEGPIDFAKKLAAGVKSLATGGGFRSGYAAKRGEIARKEDLKSNVRFAMEDWGKTKQSLLAVKPTITPDDVVDWANNYFKGSFIPGPYIAGRDNEKNPNNLPFEIVGKPSGVENADVSKWLEQQWQHNYAKAATYTSPPPTPPLAVKEPVPPIPADGSVIDTNRGKYTVRSGAWQDSTGNPADPAIADQLTRLYNEQNKIVGVVGFPPSDVSINTSQGVFIFTNAVRGIYNWYKSPAAGARLGSPITDPAVIQRLNEIAKQQATP